jgi:hypothetical protein
MRINLPVMLLASPLAVIFLASPLAVIFLASPLAAAPSPILARDLLIRVATPSLRFQWTAPAEAAIDPALFSPLRADALALLATQTRSAAAEARLAAKDKAPLRAHAIQQRWAAEADTGPLLVLASTLYSYTGGAHGSSSSGALIWDRRAQRRLKFRDLFHNWPAAEAIIRPQWCAALDAERLPGAERRNGAARRAGPDRGIENHRRSLCCRPVCRRRVCHFAAAGIGCAETDQAGVSFGLCQPLNRSV